MGRRTILRICRPIGLIALIGGLLFVLSANAADCLDAPYGATQDAYESMIEGAASGAETYGLPPKVMVELVKGEVRMACAAKYLHAGLSHYAALGISARQIARDSVAQLAAADMHAENDRAKATVGSQINPITVRDFVIEGPRLAKEGAVVRIEGVYVRAGGMEYLFADSSDVALAESPGYDGEVARVPLLTNDASDSAREAFLDCSQNPGNAYVGCPISVKGTVTQCQETSVYGGKREIECLDVKGLTDEDEGRSQKSQDEGAQEEGTTPMEAAAHDFPAVDDFYPSRASHKGEQGTALVKICIDASGALSQPPTIKKSSGHRSLDQAALQYARATSGHWRAETKNGVAVPSCTTLLVKFQLTF